MAQQSLNYNFIFFLTLLFVISYYSPLLFIYGIIIGKYPYVKRLNNDNYIIVSSRNIAFADSTLTKAYKSLNFDSDVYSNFDDFKTTAIAQFPAEDNGYILVNMLKIIYIFSSNGEYMNEIRTSIEYQENFPFTILTDGHFNNSYYSILLYPPYKQCSINILRIIYDSSTNNITFDDGFQLKGICYSFSCNILKNNSNKYIACVYTKRGGNDVQISIQIYNPMNNYKSIDIIKVLYMSHITDYENNIFNSIVVPFEKKIFFACYFENYFFTNTLQCFSYNIETNLLSTIYSIPCECHNDCNVQNIIIEYFYETDKFIVAFMPNDDITYLTVFSNDLNYTGVKMSYDNSIFSEIKGEIGIINIVFPAGANQYNIFYNPNPDCYPSCNLAENIMKGIGQVFTNLNDYPTTEVFTGVICDSNYYYDYESKLCLEDIPPGFYCNDTKNRTLDKCHRNCKTCKMGGTDNQNNCKTCDILGTNKFYDLGNCKENCENGIFIDPEDSIEKCKCSKNIRCEKCTEKSIELDLCVSCNKKEGFFQKIDEPLEENMFINCYNNPEGYYFNEINEDYEPCYLSCISCTELGNDIDNKCIECKLGYEFKNDMKGNNNCYKICEFYYFFDKNNKYFCTENNTCPKEYNKLIKNQNRCIEDCKSDNLYLYFYEHNNTCHETCPKGTIPLQNYTCIDLLIPDFDMETNESIENCSASNLFKNRCFTNNTDKNIKQNIYFKIVGEITSNKLNELLDEVLNNAEDFLIDENNIKYQITSTKNQNDKEYNNISTIFFHNCEKTLKQYYNINENDSLIILKIDIYKEGLISPFVIYDLFHPITKEKLNLIYCQNEKIMVTLPAQIDENNLFKHDPSNNFYKDICYSYTTENNTDITLNDRQKEFLDNNLSLCEDNCYFDGYDSRTKKVKCNCNIKIEMPFLSEIEIDKKKLKQKFFDIKSNTNLELMKCYQALFSKNGLKANIGSYILFSIIFIYLILYNLFFLIEYDHIMNKINKIIEIKINRNKKNKEKKFIKNTINEITTNIIKKNKNKKKSKNQKKPYNKNAPIKKVKKSKGKNISTSSRLGLSSGVGESIINSNNINLGDINKKNTKEINNINNMIILFNDSELNSMKFEEALKYDKRTFIKYYISLLRTKHLLLFAFMPSSDYNSGLLKKCISLFSFSLYYTINGLFFTNSTIHEIYEEKGKYDLFTNYQELYIQQ